ncbi:hypothetical protein AAU61_14065 [Desulfocarbo indianensis]|nr:hypothetical protein AAU61_14065 [Desulfocarbo indianensis]
MTKKRPPKPAPQPEPAIQGQDDQEWIDPDLRWKRANEAWLQAHWKLSISVIAFLFVTLFVLPWVCFPFLTALGIQLFSAAALWAVAKRYTTAFSKNR